MSTEETVPSPCLRICAVDGRSGFCMGCNRTLKEITAWSEYTNDEKREVLAAIKRRKEEVGPIEYGAV